MIKHLKLWCTLIMAGVIVDASAQAITAASNVFTFPPITAIKASRNALQHASYFTSSNLSSRFAGVRLAWSFPSQPQYQKGSIVLYSPLGRVLKTLPLSANSGTVLWGADKAVGMGVYIAKITCGTNSQSLKLIICQ